MNDVAKIAAKAAELEVKILKESLRNLELRKNKADKNLRRADKAPSVEDKAEVRAEERQPTTSAEETELITQIDNAKSDLKEKIAVAAAAVTAAKDAGLVNDEAKKALKAPASEAALMKQAFRKLEGRKKRADAKLRRANMALAAANKAKVQAEEQQRKATAKIAELGKLIELSKSTLKSWKAAAAIADEVFKESKIRKAEAAQEALDAKLALEPVSVYISRATQRLYVRRKTDKPAPDEGGRGTVFDASIEVPVTIRNPDKPIGTHIFTAMEHNDSGLRWSAVTIDIGEDAGVALDRITIPQDVLDRIAPTALPRSSIIISDEPLSKETNYRTEFISVLSNQPQGGFITRKRTRASVVEKLSDNAVIPNRQKPVRREVPSIWRAPSFLDH